MAPHWTSHEAVSIGSGCVAQTSGLSHSLRRLCLLLPADETTAVLLGAGRTLDVVSRHHDFLLRIWPFKLSYFG